MSALDVALGRITIAIMLPGEILPRAFDDGDDGAPLPEPYERWQARAVMAVVDKMRSESMPVLQGETGTRELSDEEIDRACATATGLIGGLGMFRMPMGHDELRRFVASLPSGDGERGVRATLNDIGTFAMSHSSADSHDTLLAALYQIGEEADQALEASASALPSGETGDRARGREMRAALKRIRDELGGVCADFEMCDHRSCRDSFAAREIAAEALAALPAGETGDGYKNARGALPWQEGDELPEDVIRRGRGETRDGDREYALSAIRFGRAAITCLRLALRPFIDAKPMPDGDGYQLHVPQEAVMYARSVLDELRTEVVSAPFGETGDGRELREWTIAGPRNRVMAGLDPGNRLRGPLLKIGEQVRVREVPSEEASG